MILEIMGFHDSDMISYVSPGGECFAPPPSLRWSSPSSFVRVRRYGPEFKIWFEEFVSQSNTIQAQEDITEQ